MVGLEFPVPYSEQFKKLKALKYLKIPDEI